MGNPWSGHPVGALKDMSTPETAQVLRTWELVNEPAGSNSKGTRHIRSPVSRLLTCATSDDVRAHLLFQTLSAEASPDCASLATEIASHW